MIDERDTIAKRVDFIHVMRGDDYGPLEPVPEIQDAVPHRFASRWVKPHCGLIEEQHGRPVQKTLRNLEAPNHAAGILAHEAMGDLGQTHALKRAFDPLLSFRLRHPIEAG